MLAPHTDDVELGCGGSIARFNEEGEADIYVAAFSTAADSVPEGFPKDSLKQEFHAAMTTLGIAPKRLSIFDYTVRKLSFSRQDILDSLIRLKESIGPDMVFLPSSEDLHQDHQTLYIEGLRAFKEITLWGYELPWNTITFPTRGFVTLEGRHIKKKWQALKAYRTQFALKRPYFSYDYIRSIATVRGVQVKAKYAEAFEVIREKW